MVENLTLLASTDPGWGKIEPVVISFGQSPAEEPDLAGPGLPPRRIGIGGGLEDSGGDQIPPQPPTAEGADENGLIRDAQRLLYMWGEDQYYLDDFQQNAAIAEVRGLLARSELVSLGQHAVISDYEVSVRKLRVPHDMLSARFLGIKVNEGRVEELGIYSPDRKEVYKVNKGLFEMFSRDGRGSHDYMQAWQKEISQKLSGKV